MNDRLDISEIFLKGPLNPNQKKKKKIVLYNMNIITPFDHSAMYLKVPAELNTRQAVKLCIPLWALRRLFMHFWPLI